LTIDKNRKTRGIDMTNSGREAVWPGLEAGVPKPLMPYSPAIRAGGWVFIAGTIASDFKTGLAPEVIQANRFLRDELELQAGYVLGNLSRTIEACGRDINKDMVRIWQWHVTDHPTAEEFEQSNNWPGIEIEPYLNARRRIVDNCPPASNLGVRELLCLGTKIEVDMLCIDDDNESITFEMPEGMSNPAAGHAPALRRGDWVFLAAENAMDRDGGKANPNLWIGSTVEQQTDYVLEKLSRIAAVAGTSLAQAVKADVYIGHPNDFAAMDKVWRKWFPDNPPARVVIPYMGMGARGARVQVALTLLADDAKLKKETIETSDAPEQPGHEPQAIKVGNLLFFSTQMAFDSSGKIADGLLRNPNFPWYGSPSQAQMRYMMKNINAICEAAGTSVQNICRRVCFHSDFSWFAESIEEWASYFPDDKPASTTIRLGGPFVVEGADTLLDLIAYVPD
jgi:enamine deaminase RidA (YjgF/YER057c/UK114 family)